MIRMWPKPRRMWLKNLNVEFHLESEKVHSFAVQLSFLGHSLVKRRQELDGLKKASWWSPCPARLCCEVSVPAVRATIDRNRIRREAHCIQFRCFLFKDKNRILLLVFLPSHINYLSWKLSWGRTWLNKLQPVFARIPHNLGLCFLNFVFSFTFVCPLRPFSHFTSL